MILKLVKYFKLKFLIIFFLACFIKVVWCNYLNNFEILNVSFKSENSIYNLNISFSNVINVIIFFFLKFWKSFNIK
jgi:hypothetical protein